MRELPTFRGPGTILAERLAKMGARGCTACAELARTMDLMGSQCHEYLDELTEQIFENGQLNPGLLGVIARWAPECAVKVGIRKLVDDAIKEWEDVS